MNLKVIASSSKGNAYILTGNDERILIECGVQISDIKHATGFNLSFDACLISHEHGDHSKSVEKLLTLGIHTYASPGTWKALGIDHFTAKEISHNEVIRTKEFDIMAFDVQHDAAQPLGFLIYHKLSGEKILFATDTYFIKYKFSELTQIIVECNYSEEILRRNLELGLPEVVAKRTRKSHFELGDVKEFLKANDLSLVQNIVLVHLSDGNSNESEFVSSIKETCQEKGCYANVIAADPGLIVDFDYMPF